LKLIFFILNFFLVTHLFSEEYVSARLWGQLGNQLFIVSNALAHAWDHGAIPIFPCLESETIRNIPLNRQKIFFRLESKVPSHIRFREQHYTSIHYTPLDYTPNSVLVGYSLSLDYFHRYEKRLQEVFAPSAEMELFLDEKYGAYLQHPCLVGIQIRVCALDIYPFCGWEYFEKAMQYFPPEAIFLVSSDRIDWVKSNFPIQGREVIFIEGNDHLEDFFLLTKCKHNIISNSTFGFWAAYLNRNPEKIVIAPSLWHAAHHELTRIGFPSKQNIYPKDWTVLDVPLYRVVPIDILRYKTTSVEGG